MKRTALATPLLLWLALMVPQAARAAGGPVAPVQDNYITVPGSPYRYAAFAARGGTVVKIQEAGAGPTVSGLRVSGRYGIPGVDQRGSMTGLSADGRTLILAEIPKTYPPRATRLLVLGTAPLSVRARPALPGWFTVDAISPDGHWLYLLHYRFSDISKYEVLAYDLAARRLLTKPVVDPREPDEKMTGFPINRVMSGDGRWAYTLYFRPSGVPFIHALDTKKRRAVCIDLPTLKDVDVTSDGHLGLGPGGTTLRVQAAGATWAVIDTRTFTVRPGPGDSAAASAAAPAAAAIHPAARRRPVTRGQSAHRQSGVGWELIVLAIAAFGLLVGAAAGITRSRRRWADARGPAGVAVIHVDARPTDREPAREETPVA